MSLHNRRIVITSTLCLHSTTSTSSQLPRAPDLGPLVVVPDPRSSGDFASSRSCREILAKLKKSLASNSSCNKTGLRKETLAGSPMGTAHRLLTSHESSMKQQRISDTQKGGKAPFTNPGSKVFVAHHSALTLWRPVASAKLAVTTSQFPMSPSSLGSKRIRIVWSCLFIYNVRNWAAGTPRWDLPLHDSHLPRLFHSRRN